MCRPQGTCAPCTPNQQTPALSFCDNRQRQQHRGAAAAAVAAAAAAPPAAAPAVEPAVATPPAKRRRISPVPPPHVAEGHGSAPHPAGAAAAAGDSYRACRTAHIGAVYAAAAGLTAALGRISRRSTVAAGTPSADPQGPSGPAAVHQATFSVAPTQPMVFSSSAAQRRRRRRWRWDSKGTVTHSTAAAAAPAHPRAQRCLPAIDSERSDLSSCEFDDTTLAILNCGLKFIPTPAAQTVSGASTLAVDAFARTVRLRFHFSGRDDPDFDPRFHVRKPDFQPNSAPRQSSPFGGH